MTNRKFLWSLSCLITFTFTHHTLAWCDEPFQIDQTEPQGINRAPAVLEPTIIETDDIKRAFPQEPLPIAEETPPEAASILTPAPTGEFHSEP